MEKVFQFAELMLHRRGYKNITYLDDNDMPRFVAYKETPVLLLFTLNEKINIKTMRTIMTFSVPVHNAKHVILVYSSGSEYDLTPDARQIVKANSTPFSPFFFETFTTDELSYDLISLVPRHELVTTFTGNKRKIPRIFSSDIVSRYYNFQPGNVIKIEDDDSISFRVVIS